MQKSGLLLGFYFGANVAICDSGAHLYEFFVLALFYGCAAFVVNHERALLGLYGAVAANLNECLNDVVKGIYVVVVNHQFPVFFHEGFELNFL